MDTSTKIMMQILEDIALSGKTEMEQPYTRYYESLDRSQPRIVVSDVLKRIVRDVGDANAEYELGDHTFKLKVIQ